MSLAHPRRKTKRISNLRRRIDFKLKSAAQPQDQQSTEDSSFTTSPYIKAVHARLHSYYNQQRSQSNPWGHTIMDTADLWRQTGPDTSLALVGAPATQDAATDSVWLYPYTRSPKEFNEVLIHGPQLQQVRRQLEAQGLDYTLPHSRAKMFVWPNQYESVLLALENLDIVLRSSHVIASSSLLPALEASIATIPSAINVRVKKNGAVLVTNAPGTSLPWRVQRPTSAGAVSTWSRKSRR